MPLRGSFQGSVTVSPLIGDPIFDIHVEVNGGGVSTHLGKISVSAPHNVDRRLPPNPSIAVGKYVLTAANGDKVYADFSGQSTLFAPGVLYIFETAMITGGTGRFEQATGTFVCERLFDTLAGQTIGNFDGVISTVGSTKR